MAAVIAEVDPISSVHAALDHVAWEGLPSGVVRQRLTELARAEARIQALKVAAARLLEQAGAAQAAGATSTGDLLARDFGGDRAAGERLVRTAQALSGADRTERALQAGQVTFEQARVIADGMAKLPESATAEQRGLAEAGLLRDAARLSLRDLRRRTDRVTDAYAEPAAVDAHENQLLEARQKRARAKTSFRMWDNRDGTCSGDFTLPEAQAAMLRAHVDRFAAPRRDHLREADEIDQRAGHGFAELCERLPQTDGTTAPAVVVTVALDALTDGLQAATLTDGTRISAGQARRLAARAQLIPAVLGSDSVPLELGRTQRLFSHHQRRALELRDRGCTFPGCDRPPGWTEINHIVPWWDGGTTDLDNAALVCAHHHRLLDRGWGTRLHPVDRVVEYRAPGGQWRRNERYRC